MEWTTSPSSLFKPDAICFITNYKTLKYRTSTCAIKSVAVDSTSSAIGGRSAIYGPIIELYHSVGCYRLSVSLCDVTILDCKINIRGQPTDRKRTTACEAREPSSPTLYLEGPSSNGPAIAVSCGYHLQYCMVSQPRRPCMDLTQYWLPRPIYMQERTHTLHNIK
jgi:hypothetical protein